MNWFIEHETPNGYETIFRGTIEACINEFWLLAKHMDNIEVWSSDWAETVHEYMPFVGKRSGRVIKCGAYNLLTNIGG